MNLKRDAISLIYALVLFACALSAGFDTFAFAFGIGDGAGQVGFVAGTLLIGTLAGGVGLAIAAFGSWSRWRGISLVALISVLLVMPAAVLYGWGSVHAMWHNTHLQMYYYSAWEWALTILPPFLDLMAAGLSWTRFRRFSSLFPAATTAR